MLSKNFAFSLKDIFNNINRSKIFNKEKHHRNLSTCIPFIFSERSNSRKDRDKDKHKDLTQKISISKHSLFNISNNSLDEISSLGTNGKYKLNQDIIIEKEKEKINIKKIENMNEMMAKYKELDKKAKNKRSKAKSQKALPSLTPKKIFSITNEKEKEKINYENEDEVIIKDSSLDIPENYIILPEELYYKLQKIKLNVVSPNINIEGNYKYYINGVAESLKEFIELDYDSIFNLKNRDNVKYLYYTTPMEIDDLPKKKLLLIDLDETLIHSEFRTKEHYKTLKLFTKISKCLTKTFSYSDGNYVYYIEVYFRPHLKEFLDEVSKYFDLAIFTAASKGYADTILDFIDPNNELFQFRLYRDACIPIQQKLYIKDLRIIKNYDPMNVILMDNSLYSFMNQPSNGMLVNSFYTNHKDNQLISAKNFLINHILPCDDIRKECEKWYHFTNLFYKGTSKETN